MRRALWRAALRAEVVSGPIRWLRSLVVSSGVLGQSPVEVPTGVRQLGSGTGSGRAPTSPEYLSGSPARYASFFGKA